MDDETNYDVWVTEVVGSLLKETLVLDPTMHKEDGVMKSVIQMWGGLNGLSVVAIVVCFVPTSGESRGGRDVMSPH